MKFTRPIGSLLIAGLWPLAGLPDSLLTAQGPTPTTPIRRGAGAAPEWQARLRPTPQIEINLATGNVLFEFETSSYLNQGLHPNQEVVLSFNSQAFGKAGDYTAGFGLGQGWTSTIGTRVEFPATDEALFTRGDGAEVRFFLQPDGSWKSSSHSRLKLEATASGWTVRTPGQWEYRHDLAGLLTEIASAEGNTYEVQWAAGQAVGTTEPSGRAASFAYGPGGSLSSLTDHYGTAWYFDYDGSGRLDEIDDPRYGSLFLTYDAVGRISTLTDFDGRDWSFTYWGGQWADRIKVLTDDSGLTTNFSYVEGIDWVRTVVTDTRGNLWRYVHDVEPSPALVRTKDPLGNEETWDYDAKRLLQMFTTPLGHAWQYEYDTEGNLTKITDPLLRTTDFQYDGLNNLTEIAADGVSSDLLYDNLDAPTSMTSLVLPADNSGLPGTLLREYFGPLDGSGPGEWNGHPSRQVGPAGSEVRWGFDALGLITFLEEGTPGANGGIRIDVDDLLIRTYVDQGGMSYPTSFPAQPPTPSAIQGRLSESVLNGAQFAWHGQATEVEYTIDVPIDSGSGVESSTLRRSFEFDQHGRLIELHEETDEPYEHVALPPGGLLMRSYCATFDDTAADGRIDISTPSGDTLTVLRDAAGRASVIQTNAGGSGEIQVSLTYFADGLLQSIVRGDGTSTDYTYLANGLTESIEHKSGATVDLHIDYFYDSRNVLIQAVETLGSETITKDYTYDDRRRLTSETRTTGSTGAVESRGYSMDQSGRRTADELWQDGVLVRSRTLHYDLDDPSTYQSANGRLTWIETFDGSGQLTETTWLFYDNPFGNASRIVRNMAGSTTYTATAFVYTDRGRPWLSWEESWVDVGRGPVGVTRGDVFETRQTGWLSRMWRTRDGTTLAPSGAEEWRSLRDQYATSFTVDASDGSVSELSLELPNTAFLTDTDVTYYGLDALETTRLALTGGTVLHQDFTAYGERLVGPSTPGSRGFAGGLGTRQAFNAAFLPGGALKMGVRYLDAATGRFLMRDPIGVSDGPDVYGFVHAQPTALVDPTGFAAQGSRQDWWPSNGRARTTDGNGRVRRYSGPRLPPIDPPPGYFEGPIGPPPPEGWPWPPSRLPYLPPKTAPYGFVGPLPEGHERALQPTSGHRHPE